MMILLLKKVEESKDQLKLNQQQLMMQQRGLELKKKMKKGKVCILIYIHIYIYKYIYIYISEIQSYGVKKDKDNKRNTFSFSTGIQAGLEKMKVEQEKRIGMVTRFMEFYTQSILIRRKCIMPSLYIYILRLI